MGERVRPSVSGEVYVGDFKKGNKDKKGTVALWIDDRNVGTKYPVFTGNVQIAGEKLRVDAWLHGYRLVKDDSVVVPQKVVKVTV